MFNTKEELHSEWYVAYQPLCDILMDGVSPHNYLGANEAYHILIALTNYSTFSKRSFSLRQWSV